MKILHVILFSSKFGGWGIFNNCICPWRYQYRPCKSTNISKLHIKEGNVGVSFMSFDRQIPEENIRGRGRPYPGLSACS